MVRKFLLSIHLILLVCVVSAQEKFERERRIAADQIPQQAKDFIDNLSFSKQVKWFLEEGIDTYSFEAKTKHIKKRYSIEFNQEGQIEDIEIKIKKADIPPNTRNTIIASFENTYDKYHINKIQSQYSGPSIDLITSFENGFTRLTKDVLKRYEIVAHVKDGKRRHEMEYLFDADGGLINRVRIIHKNTDHLEF